MPGSFDAANFLEISKRYSKRYRRRQRDANTTEHISIVPHYISRFQSWITNPWKSCKVNDNSGKYVSTSCVFGVGDISSLLQRPQLVAHKFYLSIEPAAFFCVYQKVRQRALQDIDKFDDTPYGDLPGPRMTRAESVEQWFNQTSLGV
ncbi:unnamed protein product [Toxocara canis]|uniref:Uncharacterized protein n=1 Tax=Toxocara canis TaxID=6265 RepID=A0A183U0I8_TOXCA|nr:unnamed protein product [Toxocara canis]